MKKLIYLLFLLPVFAQAQRKSIDISSMATPGSAAILPNLSTMSGFLTTVGSASNAQIFTVSGSLLTSSVSILPPVGYAVSADNITYVTNPSTVTLPVSGGNTVGSPTNVYIRLTGASTGTITGNVTLSSSGASTVFIGLNGLVNPLTPTMNVIGTFGAFNTTVGSFSASQTVTLSGSNLTNNVVITAPTGMEVSIDGGSSYANSKTATQSGGSIPSQPINVMLRIANTASAGTISGTPLSFVSSGATTVNLTVNGTVSSGSSQDSIMINIANQDGTGVVTSAAPFFVNNYQPDVSVGAPGISAALSYLTGVSAGAKIQIDVAQFYVDNNTTCSCTYAAPAPFITGMGRVAIGNNGTPDHVTLSLLPSAANGYKVLLFGGRSTASTQSVTVSSGSATATVNMGNSNTTLIATLDNLTPASGNIVINMNANTAFWFINAILVVRKNGVDEWMVFLLIGNLLAYRLKRRNWFRMVLQNKN